MSRRCGCDDGDDDAVDDDEGRNVWMRGKGQDGDLVLGEEMNGLCHD